MPVSRTLRFRLRRTYLVIAVVSLSFWLLLGGLCAYGMLTDPPARPVAGALFFGGTLGCFSLLSLYLLMFYRRQELRLDPEGITHRLVWRTRRIALAEIEEVRWRPYAHMASARIRAPGERIVIHFDGYLIPEQQQIVAYLRGMIPERVHMDWDEDFTHTKPQTFLGML